MRFGQVILHGLLGKGMFKRRILLIAIILYSLVCVCCPATKQIPILLDIPFVDQLRYESTEYIICHSIDLGGQRIKIPDNSILKFKKKGRLRNGVLIGNNTIISAQKKQIFENIEIEQNGTWNTIIGYPEWFGATNDKNVDSKMAIQKAIDVSSTCILSKNYYMSYNTQTGRGDDKRVCAIAIKGKKLIGKSGYKLYIDAKYSNTEKTSVFWIGDDVTIDGVNIEFLNEVYSGWTGIQAGVYRVQGGNVTIKNTTLRGAMAAWINLIGHPGRENFVIKNNFVHDCDCGLVIQGSQHQPEDVYSIKLLMENNVIEKEKQRHSEFVSFWGGCQGKGKVYYTDVIIRKNKFSGGYQGGCITGDPQYNGLKNVVIIDNEFNDCGACSFYNSDGLVYEHNYVTGSSFIERQVKGIMGSYPDLCLYNCSNSLINDCSCFGLTIMNCKDLHIGQIKQTLCLKENDPYLAQKDYVTNFIGINAVNSTVTIDELIVNPFADNNITSTQCKYYIHKGNNANITIDKMITNIPILDKQKRIKVRVFIRNK